MIIVAFVVIWLAGDLAIQAVERLSIYSRLSRFTLALIVMGAVAALPEVSITANALLLNSEQVALGSLIGSQVFLLFFAIPVLALISRGLKLQAPVQNLSLVLTLLLALVPMLTLLNQGLEIWESMTILAIYVVFLVSVARQEGALERITETITTKIRALRGQHWAIDVVKLILAIAFLALAGNVVVRQIIQLAAEIQMPRFFLSFLLLPIATNLPEVSIALRSVLSGSKNIAVGDYLGSITFNALLLVGLALGSGGILFVGQNISFMIMLFVVGVITLGFFCYTRKNLSVLEGLTLLAFYFGFISLGWWQGRLYS